jgi:prepilin-type N-terminal cleavage/methylation domain-containing protein
MHQRLPAPLTAPISRQNSELRPHGRGFTLVELLVVIGVIALLAGLLLPVLAAARENGRNSTCLQNLRQLYVAYQLYSADHGGYVPPYQNRLRRESVPEHGDLLVASLGPYSRSERTWFCPADSFAGTSSTVGDIRHEYASYRTGVLASITRPYPMAVTMDGPKNRRGEVDPSRNVLTGRAAGFRAGAGAGDEPAGRTASRGATALGESGPRSGGLRWDQSLFAAARAGLLTVAARGWARHARAGMASRHTAVQVARAADHPAQSSKRPG